MELWVAGILQKMGFRQVEKGFASFLVKFLPYLMIFQSFALALVHSTLKNNQIWQKFGK